ncbi:hypothetical protein M752DRAFT_326569 [Aspergillus phoenicis ATCC 13157]|uniref:Aminotransferase class I/classII domain-containing protein n=1 Tax=Aspergillus phoenicis ATCC 13157 TaxID=1353007 RepID=A0A370PKW5_ASPPH|nr:hypothetical protein M752DRAFT_326569 [Aspergillus phoenicis ATCC 13157]
MQSFGKGPGALGGVVMRDPLIKKYMANSVRGLMYSNGPSFPTIAAIKASFSTLSSADGKQVRTVATEPFHYIPRRNRVYRKQRRQRLRTNIKLFHRLILMHPMQQTISNSSVLKFPSIEHDKNEEISVAIIPIMSEQGQCHKLQQRLQEYRFRTHVVLYPAVSKEEKRVRLMLHADNKPDEIRGFVHVLMNWGWERVQVGAKLGSRL